MPTTPPVLDLRHDRTTLPPIAGQTHPVAIDAYWSRPAAAGRYPVVVVVQEIFGVNEHIRDVCDRLAREGYFAIAPALYQRLAPGFETGYTPEDVKIGRDYKERTRADELLGDIQAAIAWAQQQPETQPGKVGCIGFCFGGHVAYLAATLPEVGATASFYGAGIVTWSPGGGEPTVTRTAAIGGTILALFGMEDASIPVDQVDAIAAEFERHGIDGQVLRYDGAEHGFFCDRRGSYNPEAAAAAWVQVKRLFAARLKGR